MDLDEVMRTTFAAREFTDEDVADAQIGEILELARFAPSGGNRQPWKVIAIRARETRERLLELCTPTIQRYIAQMTRGENPWNDVDPTTASEEEVAATEVPPFLTNPVLNAPVLLLVMADRRRIAAMDRNLTRTGIISGASIYPFVQNLLLAARSRGLAGVCTTFASGSEPDVQALVGAPAEYAVAAVVPLGHPVKQLTRLRRQAVEEFAVLERFDGPVLGTGNE